ncbi:hypothetical protein [Actinokineospora enzanensis]|uniref:hypothetical protein n=1 Tax=Actinokineospora enzanensis TaxID=155975 RepID=UPI00036D51FF|nr:hypothetical protein [Actinokineospora enzanensis]
MIDVEQLMDLLANSGVTVLLKADHERMAVGGRPWTLVLSGLDDGGIRVESLTMTACLDEGIAQLRRRPGDWEWLAEFTTGSADGD